MCVNKAMRTAQKKTDVFFCAEKNSDVLTIKIRKRENVILMKSLLM